MTENKATSSIARKINLDFWIHQLFLFLILDGVLAILIMAVLYRVYGMQWDELRHFFYDIRMEAGIFVGVEMLFLLTGMFRTRKIRRIMRPLNEMAKKAEKLGSIAFDTSKFSNLEDAISHIQPDEPNATLSTGDKDLQSLEVAINNLLERMRQVYLQQNQFVSDASHELRTPIAVFQGYIQMLDRWGKEDEEILNESIEALKNESEHMKKLVEQLLFLARGDCGRNVLSIERFCLTEVVNQVYEEFCMIDEKHRYVFQGGEEVWIEGDVSMVKQMLRIFTDNAAKYSQVESRIDFLIKRTEKEVTVEVQDEGEGMEGDVACHVFDRFYRSDEARNSKTGGTGLGLSIAKWIADAHGGVIEIKSCPGFGTRFAVKFPINN